jgi:hypothetical protein
MFFFSNIECPDVHVNIFEFSFVFANSKLATPRLIVVCALGPPYLLCASSPHGSSIFFLHMHNDKTMRRGGGGETTEPVTVTPRLARASQTQVRKKHRVGGGW